MLDQSCKNIPDMWLIETKQFKFTIEVTFLRYDKSIYVYRLKKNKFNVYFKWYEDLESRRHSSKIPKIIKIK